MENRVYTRGLTVILLLWFFFNIAQEVFPFSKLEKQFYAFEFLSFKSADLPEKTFLEIFCQISTDKLIFIKYKDGFFASYEILISLHDLSGNEFKRQSLIDSVKVKTFKDIDRPRASKLIRFNLLLEPGEYEARIKLTDLETLRDLNFHKNIQVPDYNKPSLQISDIEIATSISASKEKDVLVKNDWKVIPNVLRVVGWEQNVLFVYVELYNLRNNSVKSNEEFIVSYVIRDEKGQEIKSVKRKSSKNSDNTYVLVASIPLPELESGQYEFILNVEDLENAQKIQKSTHFFIMKQNSKLQPYPNFSDSKFAKKSR